MADGKKQRIKLADGRKVRLTAPQVQLYELCKRVENLPREIIEKVLEDLPWSILQSLKYSRGLHDIAFDLVHQVVYIYGRDGDEVSRDKLTSLASAIRTLNCWDEKPNYELLVEFLTPNQLPSLRSFRLDITGTPPMTVDDARMLIEHLGALPFLSVLEICDGGPSDEKLPKASKRASGPTDEELPKASKRASKKAIKRLRNCKVLDTEDRASLFPSLRELILSNASPALAACMLSKQCPLSQLKRLQLIGLRSEVRVEDFPRELTALDITSCDHIGFNDLLQLARLSQNTLEYLDYRDQGQQPLLNYVGSPIINCPRLKYLVVHDASFDEGNRDDEAIQTPKWTRTGIGLISRIEAPELRSLGIGRALCDASPDAVDHLIAGRVGSKLGLIACRYPPPATLDNDDLGGQDEFTIQQLNLAAATTRGDELGGIDLICFPQRDNYDNYFSDAFAGNYWVEEEPLPSLEEFLRRGLMRR